MSAPVFPACVHCGKEIMESHCDNSQCSWIRCKACNQLTWVRKATEA